MKADDVRRPRPKRRLNFRSEPVRNRRFKTRCIDDYRPISLEDRAIGRGVHPPVYEQ